MVGISKREATLPARRRRRLAADLTPLRRSRDFRLLWLGDLVSQTGSNITLVAVYVQVYALTHSAFAVGAIGLAQLVPLVLTSLFASPLIDRADRRRLLLVSQVGQAGGSAILLATTLVPHPSLAAVYVGAGVVGGLSGFAMSTRSAMVPNLVPPEQLPAALALNQVMWNACLIVGPALGGIVAARFGLGWAYGIDVASFGATILAAALVRPMPPARQSDSARRGLRAVGEGFRYLRGRRVLQSTFIIDLFAMVFGLPRALFPVLAVQQFHGGAGVVGALFSAIGVGALLGALGSGWVGRVRRQGLAVLVAVTIWGCGIIGFGLSGSLLLLALTCLAVAGAADVISAVFRSTILQLSVPDDLRGRISAVHILVVTGGPRLGDVESGAVAAAVGATASVVIGGVLCLAGVALVAVLVPEFARARGGRADVAPPTTVDAARPA